MDGPNTLERSDFSVPPRTLCRGGAASGSGGFQEGAASTSALHTFSRGSGSGPTRELMPPVGSREKDETDGVRGTLPDREVIANEAGARAAGGSPKHARMQRNHSEGRVHELPNAHEALGMTSASSSGDEGRGQMRSTRRRGSPGERALHQESIGDTNVVSEKERGREDSRDNPVELPVVDQLLSPLAGESGHCQTSDSARYIAVELPSRHKEIRRSPTYSFRHLFFFSGGNALPLSSSSSSASSSSSSSPQLQGDFFNTCPAECVQAVFHLLPVEDILRMQVVSSAFFTTIRDEIGAFTHVRSLVLDAKWAKLEIHERQQMLLQMVQLQHLEVQPEAFTGGSIFIQEVAALVYRNARTLRSLRLLSPENPLCDETPLHNPFAFKPRSFSRLRVITLIGSQAFEWGYILSNCNFPVVERFEVSYFPPASIHWSWKVGPDFTLLGIDGLRRMLDKMELLERLTLGFEIRFEDENRRQPWEDALDDPVDPQLNVNVAQYDGVIEQERRRLGLAENGPFSATLTASNRAAVGSGYWNSEGSGGPAAPDATGVRRAWPAQTAPAGAVGASAARMWQVGVEDGGDDLVGVEPVGGRGQLSSWRGKVSEEDFADLCAVAYVRAGGAGNLKRIVVKHRSKTGEETSSQATVSSVAEFFQDAASFCYRYVSDVFTGLQPLAN
ncbi:putative F-box domain-containing protein [Neospora caninum Liverpool]|uniref:F-box domain-containing protein, putative n=1 Tax=Neospora caninum (strain Liverpool) TaxID=572307 RepID=F0VL40_NEOCL|nr:putative F-box domain-containing protein [Neospora caninum Liverpool]CBZ54792.1 putative F-box domain-containing protein [Neospora caninum Liverpool]CEL69509.1 TPA: F-box domain-containing protein, putative [Neospora caninum Liverpool]|eukprot:XP_003884820.1 putative F-box domain-containing protein [Neospora caninum Liverpool]